MRRSSPCLAHNSVPLSDGTSHLYAVVMTVDRKLMGWFVGEVNRNLCLVGESRSCIFAGHVAIQALKALWGLDSLAIATDVRICNPLLVSRLRRLRNPTPAEIEKATSMEGSCQVLLDPGSAECGRWPRHLVVVVPRVLAGKGVLLDLTLPQFEQRQKGIYLQPVLAFIDSGFAYSSKRVDIPIRQSLVVYNSFPRDRSFEVADAWTWSDKHAYVLERILAADRET